MIHIMRRRRNVIPQIWVIIIVIAIALLSKILPQEKQPSRHTHLPPAEVGTQFTGKCVGVADGDTIRVMHLGREEKIRLFGVDSPEKKQAYGSAAKKFTSSMVFGKTVTVEVRDTDRYGRTVGWVKTSDGRVLNIELVRAGFAWWYRDYDPDDTKLANLEESARQAKRGLWQQKNPTPPWDYRRMEREERRRY